jgi:hypothetical protein
MTDLAAVSTWLSPDEVSELTGKQPNSYAAQRRALAWMRVEFRTRPDGRPMVLRSHVDGMIGARSERRPREPDWSAMDGTSTP